MSSQACGAHAAGIAAAVGELADPHTEFVGTTDWLSPADGDFDGTVHPAFRAAAKWPTTCSPFSDPPSLHPKEPPP